MWKMTEKTFLALFEYGKKVYKKELSTDEATKRANRENPEVAVSSAKHYITWYSRMRAGEFLTWNTNAQLLVFYAKRIIEEEGNEAGATAISSARKYAQNAGRTDLDGELVKLAADNGIDLKSPNQPVCKNNTDTFKAWLKNHKDKNYTEHTIYVYIHALEMIEEWLGIKLSMPVLSTNSIAEYETIYEEITSVPNYRDLNQRHGHGEMSASLTMYKEFIEEKSQTWWPLKSEYDPGITKEMWMDILNNSEIIGPVWGGFLAAFYSEPSGASCKQIGEKYNRTPSSIIGNCTQLGKRIYSETNCPILKRENGQNIYWTIMFQGRDANGDEIGGFIWKLRPELYDALTDYDIMRFEWKGDEEVIDINTKEALAEIKRYIFARGFDYPEGLIENFYLSIKSKPFVILAGTSGTGKTRLVKLFAEAIGAVFELVAVRPDWSDGSDLFGHTDLNGNFIPGPVCDAFNAAIAAPNKPIFLCLDEMNLARVEYYLSDFLSVIESRERESGHIVTEGIAQYESGIPENLYIIGTVNMDETTFPFSKKVLDRANTTEFSYVDLMSKPRTGEMFIPQNLSNSFLCTEFLVLATDCMNESDLVNKICIELQALNEKLLKANAHVGYRVRDENVFYILNNKRAGALLTYEQVMDNEIMQKILPRIQGSSASIKTLLVELFKFCMGSSSGIDIDIGNVGEQMKNAASSAKYPESAKKLVI